MSCEQIEAALQIAHTFEEQTGPRLDLYRSAALANYAALQVTDETIGLGPATGEEAERKTEDQLYGEFVSSVVGLLPQAANQSDVKVIRKSAVYEKIAFQHRDILETESILSTVVWAWGGSGGNKKSAVEDVPFYVIGRTRSRALMVPAVPSDPNHPTQPLPRRADLRLGLHGAQIPAGSMYNFRIKSRIGGGMKVFPVAPKPSLVRSEHLHANSVLAVYNSKEPITARTSGSIHEDTVGNVTDYRGIDDAERSWAISSVDMEKYHVYDYLDTLTQRFGHHDTYIDLLTKLKDSLSDYAPKAKPNGDMIQALALKLGIESTQHAIESAQPAQQAPVTVKHHRR